MARGDTARRAKKQQDYYWAHRDEILKKQKEQRSTPEYKAKIKEYYKKHKDTFIENQKERRIAQRIERQQIMLEQSRWRNGKLNPKEDKCFICGAEEKEKLLSHHPDYALPALTVTLCYSCHQRVHRGTYKLNVEAKKCPVCGLYSYRLLIDPISVNNAILSKSGNLS